MLKLESPIALVDRERDFRNNRLHLLSHKIDYMPACLNIQVCSMSDTDCLQWIMSFAKVCFHYLKVSMCTQDVKHIRVNCRLFPLQGLIMLLELAVFQPNIVLH